MRDHSTAIRILAIFVFTVIAVFPGFGPFIVALILYSDTVSSVNSLKTNGSLDDIRNVPSSDADLSRSIFRALFKAGLPYLIALTLFPGLGILSSIPMMFYDPIFGAWDFADASTEMLAALSQYSCVIALAAYWGIAEGSTRLRGFFVYALLLFLGSVLGSVIWAALNSALPIPTAGVPRVITDNPCRALVLAALLGSRALHTTRSLGKRWREDFSESLHGLAPHPLGKVTGPNA